MIYVDGLETDRPLAITRNHYADASSTSGSETYAVYAPFSIIPLWNSQGRADQAVVGGTAAPGQDYLCVDATTKTRCAEVFLDWGVFPYARSGAAMGSWNGTLLLDKPDATGTYYRRNRSYDPATARFTQEDPIGLAGGLNEYGFASGDPANYGDPFGLCTPWPDCMFQGLANWGAARGGTVGSAMLNIGAGLNAVSEALGVNDFGKAVAEKNAVGIGLGLVSIVPIGRAGAVGKTALSLLMKEAAENPEVWRTIGAFTEAATHKGLNGGLSIQRIIENQSGDRLVQHTLLDKAGNVVEQHYRPMYKPREEIDIP